MAMFLSYTFASVYRDQEKVDRGKFNTSVALFLPLNRRLSLRIAASVMTTPLTWPRKRKASCALCRKSARDLVERPAGATDFAGLV